MTEIKNMLEGFLLNNRLADTEELISDMEDRVRGSKIAKGKQNLTDLLDIK